MFQRPEVFEGEAKLWEKLRKPSPPPQLLPYPNALRSINGGGGPQTEEGKAISSRNSTIHGLTAKRTVLPGEDHSEFDALLARLTDDRKPEGELEIQLTGEIAAALWRLARARDHEARILETTYGLYEDRGAAKLELVMRYSGAIERQMHRTIARLELCQTQRRKLAAAEFVSQVAEMQAPEPAPLVMVAGASIAHEPPELPAAAETPAFVSQPEESPAPLVMVAGASAPYVAQGQLTEVQEFVSQLPEDTDLTDADFLADIASIDRGIEPLANRFGERGRGGKKNRMRR